MEHYLFYIRDYGLRNTLTKFRLSSHHLEIEKGRHARPKIPVEQRKCSKCDLNVVESETHFLIECDFYTEERRNLYSKLAGEGFRLDVEAQPPNIFEKIMCLQGKAPFYVSIFLTKCFKKRDAS